MTMIGTNVSVGIVFSN